MARGVGGKIMKGLATGFLLLLMSGQAFAAAAPSASHADLAERVLAAHNRERMAVGAPPLQWDPNLASSAASYGPTLARMGRLIHSPRTNRPGQRENLAMG